MADPQQQLFLVLELVFAGALVAALGYQRFHTGHPAGMRTHILVSVASCAFTMIGLYGFGAGHAPGDPSRVAAQVVSGIGFLGAGVIWKTEKSVVGVTTAASLWAAASIGVLVGAQLFIVAVGVTLIFYVALALLREVGPAVPQPTPTTAAPDTSQKP